MPLPETTAPSWSHGFMKLDPDGTCPLAWHREEVETASQAPIG